MKIFKLLFLSLLISSNGFSQSPQSSNQQEVSLESITPSEIETLVELLDLSNEQKDRVSQVLNGITQKNAKVSSMNLTEENKTQIFEGNKQAKTSMILNILNETQKAIYIESLSH